MSADSRRALDEYRTRKIIKRYWPLLLPLAVIIIPAIMLRNFAKHPASIAVAAALPVISTNSFT